MSDPGSHSLFVYGSLRSGFRSPAYEYMSRFFTFIGDGFVRGRLYDMEEYAAGKPVNEDFFITGELYMLKNENEFSWAFGQLDDYEGINPESGETALFRRDMVDVRLGNDIKRAWIYWFNGDVTGRPVIDSGDLMEYIQRKNKH